MFSFRYMNAGIESNKVRD